jgi:hypothetical protein
MASASSSLTARLAGRAEPPTPESPLSNEEPPKTEPPLAPESETPITASQPLVNTEFETPIPEPQKTEPKLNHPESSSPSAHEQQRTTVPELPPLPICENQCESVSEPSSSLSGLEPELLDYITYYRNKYHTDPPEQELEKVRRTLNRINRAESKINRQAS